MKGVTSYYLSLLLSIYVTTVVVTQSVAPGDADNYCLDQSGRIPTSNTEHILVDTQNYRSGALVTATGGNGIWLSVDFDEPNSTFYRRWYDNNQGIECKHYLLACGTDQSGQDNWLITQYINITDVGVKELTINVTFATDSTCTNCQQSYSVSAFQTNEINETFRNNSSAYYDTGVRLIHTAGQDRFSFRQGRFKVTSTGLYLAIIDKGSCTAIQRLVVYYDICPYQVKNLIIYPQTVAPSISFSQDIDIIGSCAENASPLSANVQLTCELNGVWDNVDVSCTCNPGYELNNTISCDACLEGYFKSFQGNDSCKVCPDNSTSTTSGAINCTCLTGYYRSRYENVTTACTAPPTSPLGLHNTSTTGTSFNITWTAPSDTGGRTDIFYIVTITGRSINKTVNITDTQYTFAGLNLSTTYTVSVRAGNGVSDQDSVNDVNRTVSITVTTPNECLSQVKNLVIYPQTLGYSQDIDTVGSCVDNASLVSANLQLTCGLNGVWDNVAVSCSCNSGYELSNTISCDACLEGYFKSFQGNNLCKKCPDNSTSTTSGATNCTCNPGYELSNNGFCDACLKGYFKLSQGNDSCKKCPDNSTSTTSGATNCTCNPGYELSNNGFCDACLKGYFKLSQGNDSCKKCPDNSTSTTSGATNCTCNPGYELSNNGFCDACLKGYFKLSQGNDSCKKCPGNSTSTISGATNCTCNPGYELSNNGFCEEPQTSSNRALSVSLGLVVSICLLLLVAIIFICIVHKLLKRRKKKLSYKEKYIPLETKI